LFQIGLTVLCLKGTSELNLKSAIAGETHEYTDMYPGYARTAREEGFDDIADWFEVISTQEAFCSQLYQFCH
jgi:rubrerythrin